MEINFTATNLSIPVEEKLKEMLLEHNYKIVENEVKSFLWINVNLNHLNKVDDIIIKYKNLTEKIAADLEKFLLQNNLLLVESKTVYTKDKPGLAYRKWILNE